MYNNRSHLLDQVPLTVSPFVSIPTATTLSYNYKAMPSALPPSILGNPSATQAPPAEDGTSTPQQPAPKPRYIISQSGHAAHPDDIIASCRALQAHITRMQKDAERELREFEERARARDLAEKRKVAPGWLDSEARILEPERKGDVAADGQPRGGEVDMLSGDANGGQGPSEMGTDEGAELDRYFGGLSMK
ncbi:hypothetical protein VD0002_g8586 [Verticillium dahliae]|uniref:Uncharacterized protein n=2 Tax=Verticillium dahliae TaxID=27337 RepID=G2XGW8_VERDV|nr:uncharacterized protein VDAG_09400 [Verticillium dahliae VdLs.17]KAF3347036.1 Septum-promoting GTP-binding protein 1 [Verticillium dahliae VDG2]KAH6693082.1 hypothetical protein EV126DRAFT_86235 [Verticillium dahliae]EGY19066.1 hypothetical protein VDAG_09400 [Verticillium dahliae VdLs.17]PNH27330.1 hypothetical protein BJF96_g9377 [Verticillium dahliae]PNH45293.1 hypothetical protein VD0003_g9249 [Verticillium dahliae]